MNLANVTFPSPTQAPGPIAALKESGSHSSRTDGLLFRLLHTDGEKKERQRSTNGNSGKLASAHNSSFVGLTSISKDEFSCKKHLPRRMSSFPRGCPAADCPVRTIGNPGEVTGQRVTSETGARTAIANR